MLYSTGSITEFNGIFDTQIAHRMCYEDEKFKALSYPVISDEVAANQIINQILQNSHAIIGMDTEAAVEMSRFGILCLLQVTKF